MTSEDMASGSSDLMACEPGVVRKQLGLTFDGETLGATHHLVVGDVQIKGLDRMVSHVLALFANSTHV